MHPTRRAPALSRRRLLGAGAGTLAGAVVLAGCGGSDPGPGTGAADTGVAPDAGPWRFTDGLGQELELDARPTRIAAYGDQAAALMHFGVTPVAIFHFVDPADDPTFDGLDLTGIPVVGTAYGEIDLERLLGEVRPDLVVTTTYDADTPELPYGFKDESQVDTVRSQVPIAGILQAGTARDVIASNTELVASLGVDVEGGRVARDRAAFEEASAALTEAAGRGLTVAAVYAEEANLWFARPADDPALALYAELGVRFVDVVADDYYWDVVSWENADTYEPDLYLYSLRTSFSPEQYAAEPTFAELPGAGQLHPWTFTSMDLVSQAAYMTELAGWLGEDRKVT